MKVEPGAIARRQERLGTREQSRGSRSVRQDSTEKRERCVCFWISSEERAQLSQSVRKEIKKKRDDDDIDTSK